MNYELFSVVREDGLYVTARIDADTKEWRTLRLCPTDNPSEYLRGVGAEPVGVDTASDIAYYVRRIPTSLTEQNDFMAERKARRAATRHPLRTTGISATRQDVVLLDCEAKPSCGLWVRHRYTGHRGATLYVNREQSIVVDEGASTTPPNGVGEGNVDAAPEGVAVKTAWYACTKCGQERKFGFPERTAASAR